MDFELIPFTSELITKQAIDEVIACNSYTERFGLALTQEQATALVKTRSLSLKENGRIEFGAGILHKIIQAFCDSPYLSMQNYAQTLHELTELFYYFKNEALDIVSDDELIDYMKEAFDGICQGSLELLSGRELNQLATDLRANNYGNFPYYGIDGRRL